LLMSKQNPIRAHAATKIRYFSDRLLGWRIVSGNDKDRKIPARSECRPLMGGRPEFWSGRSEFPSSGSLATAKTCDDGHCAHPKSHATTLASWRTGGPRGI
jgi:hypothetical protein